MNKEKKIDESMRSYDYHDPSIHPKMYFHMPELSVFDGWMDGLFIISRLDDDDSDSYKAKKYNKHCV